MPITKKQRSYLSKTQRTRLQYGVCIWCGGQLATTSDILCIKHLKNARRYSAKSKIKAVKRGMCRVCMVNPFIPGMTICSECKEGINTYRKILREYRKANGLCTRCEKKLENEKYSDCLGCRLQQQGYYLKRKKKANKEIV